MITIAPPTGPNNTVQLATLATTTGNAALAAGSLATALGVVTTQIQTITTNLVKSNRGTAIGVKKLTAGNNVAVNNAVLERRNTLAGANDQFPIPPAPPGI